MKHRPEIRSIIKKTAPIPQLLRWALNEEGFWTAVEVGISNTSSSKWWHTL
jgi:hypothetical protein